MAQMHAMRLTTLALILGGGLPLLANAQQTYGAPPAYNAPPTQYEKPLTPGAPPRVQDPSSGDIQLYSQPGEVAEPPAMPPPRPYAAPSQEQVIDYPHDRGPGWSSPAGSGQIQNDQGIRYISGGVSEDERAELETLSGQFNLRLLFAMQGSGNYLADVRVRILDPSGAVVLSAESKGPWFFAQLPPDTYTVEVSTPDQSQRQTLQIDQRQSRLNFYWR